MPRFPQADPDTGEVETAGARFAVLDGDGVICEVSPDWARFAIGHGGDLRTCGVGASYLAVCDAVPDDPVSTAVGSAIRTAATGRLPSPHRFLSPCPGIGRSGWFEIVVLPRGGGSPGALVSVQETTLFVTTVEVEDGALAKAYRAAAHSRDVLVARRLQHLASHDLFQLTLRLSALTDLLDARLANEVVTVVADVDRTIRTLLEWSMVLSSPSPGPDPPST